MNKNMESPTTEELKEFFTKSHYEGQLYDKVTSYMTSLVCEKLSEFVKVHYNPNIIGTSPYKLRTPFNGDDFKEDVMSAFNNLLIGIVNEMKDMMENRDESIVEISLVNLSPILSDPTIFSPKRGMMINYRIINSKTRTKGNVIVEDIKLNDIHYEYEYGCFIKSKVVSLPQKNEAGNWFWQSECLLTGNIINYEMNPDPRYTHYTLNLYDYEAYFGAKQIGNDIS